MTVYWQNQGMILKCIHTADHIKVPSISMVGANILLLFQGVWLSYISIIKHLGSIGKEKVDVIQGGPERMQHLRSIIFKKTRDRMNKLCALLCIKFFFQQNYTKIVNFDEGVLILEPFFWGNVIIKICTFCIKSPVWGREEFLWVAPPDSNAAKLRNECFSLFMLALFSCTSLVLQSKSRHFARGSQTMESFQYVNLDFWDRRANLENDIASEKRP